jgi:hypothetical protein
MLFMYCFTRMVAPIGTPWVCNWAATKHKLNLL